MNNLCKFPSQVHSVLDAKVESLSAGRRMNVRRVAAEEHPPLSVRRRLSGRVAKTREVCDAMEAKVRPIDGDERLAQLTLGRVFVLPDLRLDQHDAHPLA